MIGKDSWSTKATTSRHVRTWCFPRWQVVNHGWLVKQCPSGTHGTNGTCRWWTLNLQHCWSLRKWLPQNLWANLLRRSASGSSTLAAAGWVCTMKFNNVMWWWMTKTSWLLGLSRLFKPFLPTMHGRGSLWWMLGMAKSLCISRGSIDSPWWPTATWRRAQSSTGHLGMLGNSQFLLLWANYIVFCVYYIFFIYF